MITEGSMLFSPQYVQHEKEGTYLLIDPISPNWISTNNIGSQIVRMCDGRHTLNEIAGRIGDDHNIGLDQARLDSRRFLERLLESDFVSEAPALKPPYLGRSEAIAPGKLSEIWIYTNNDCNLSCLHCLVSASGRQSATMTTTQIKDLVAEAKHLGANRVYFTGGEPFLREDILDLVEHVTRDVQLVILSNGILLDDSLVGELKSRANNNLIVQVSLEAPTAEINDQLRGRGSFDKAVSGIKSLIRGGLTPIVTTTITRLNVDYAVQTTEFLASLGVKDHHILWLHPRGRGQENLKDLFVDAGQLTETMRSLFERSQELGILVDNKESLRVRARARRGRKNDLCNSCFEMLCVDSNMQVYPCPSLNGDERFACGSLEEQTLEEIFLKSPLPKWIRENSVQKKAGCNDCYLKFFCGGGCFCQAYFNYEVEKGFGCIMAPDPYCNTYKSLFEDLFWELARPLDSIKGNSEARNGEADKPKLFASMDAALPACAASSVKVTNAAFEVAGFHCACVLGAE